MKISKSKTFKDEYCATIVKIGDIFPIEGKDRIVKTMVTGLSIVIGKDEFKTGDVAVYCANETAINKEFLHINSMFDDVLLNADNTKRGYINKHGRIRIVKLGGVPSYGLLLNPDSIASFLKISKNEVIDFLSTHVNEDFDEINGERFIQVYLPPIKQRTPSNKSEKRQKKLKRFKMLIDGNFKFHYDTEGLQKHMNDINPDDEVYISCKLHGTSGIFANILTNIPTPWYKRLWRKYVKHINKYEQKYNLIYSSRNVIKNEFINKKQKPGGYYSDDVWGYWAQKLNGVIPEDYEIYGEILGFTPNGTAIQKGYDYGCEPFAVEKSKLMVYRITYKGKELEIPEVINFGAYLKEKLGDIIIEFPLLYHGTMKELYPDVVIDGCWHENVLERLKNEKKFLMEKNEPMCKNKVPREGFVLRKAHDVISEAWKLKTFSFLNRESKLIDSGEVDMEMEENFTEN